MRRISQSNLEPIIIENERIWTIKVRIGRRKFHNTMHISQNNFPEIISVHILRSHILDSFKQIIQHVLLLLFFRVKMVFQDSKVTWVLKVIE